MLFDQLVTPVIETHAVGLSNSAPNPTRSALRPRSPRCQSEAIAVGDDVGEEFSSMAAPSAEEFPHPLSAHAFDVFGIQVASILLAS